MSSKLNRIADHFCAQGYTVTRQPTRRSWPTRRMHYQLTILHSMPALKTYSSHHVTSDWMTMCWLAIDADGVTMGGPGYRSGKHWPLTIDGVYAGISALRADTLAYYDRLLDREMDLSRHFAAWDNVGGTAGVSRAGSSASTLAQILHEAAERCAAILRVRAAVAASLDSRKPLPPICDLLATQPFMPQQRVA